MSHYEENDTRARNLAVTLMGLAGAVMVSKWCNNHRRDTVLSSKRKGMRKKLKRFFNVEESRFNSLYVSNGQLGDKFLKLQDFSRSNILKNIEDPQTRREYIFFKLLKDFEGRFKTKTLMN